MIVSEEEFSRPDPKNKRYSHLEIDFYGWVSPSKGANHRLSVRKDLETGKYQAYALYYATIRRPAFESILFDGTLEEALKYADNLYFKYHNDRHYDTVAPKPVAPSGSV